VARQRAALGLKVRTGRAIVVALGGTIDAPEILVKTRIDVATTFEEGALFHMAQKLDVEAARAYVDEAEARFTAVARAQLTGIAAKLDARVVAVALVAPPVKRLPPFETILKAHPLIHAAEGELYRRVFARAAVPTGPEPTRVPAEELVARTAKAVGLTPAKLDVRLSVLGKASGKPWAADQKQAMLVAWLALATA
jgi:hypothetical protein